MGKSRLSFRLNLLSSKPTARVSMKYDVLLIRKFSKRIQFWFVTIQYNIHFKGGSNKILCLSAVY
jgi:hypothetical protein